MGCCSSRAPGSHEWQAQVPGSYKANPIPKVNKQTEVAPDFFMKCYMKGYLRTLPKKQRIWCMIHENNLYFMDTAEDTLPKKFLCFDGCLVNLKGKELEIQVKHPSSLLSLWSPLSVLLPHFLSPARPPFLSRLSLLLTPSPFSASPPLASFLSPPLGPSPPSPLVLSHPLARPAPPRPPACSLPAPPHLPLSIPLLSHASNFHSSAPSTPSPLIDCPMHHAPSPCNPHLCQENSTSRACAENSSTDTAHKHSNGQSSTKIASTLQGPALTLPSGEQTPEIMEGAVPRATYKFVAEGEDVAMEWYEASLKASSRRN